MLQHWTFRAARLTCLEHVVRHGARAMCLAILIAATSTAGTSQSKPPAMPLRIYFIDTEGGQATLFVLPNHTTLLVDTGFPRPNARDAIRIVRAAKLAGVERIDYLLFTHYHVDHAGDISDLAARIPIGTFFDHGASVEPEVAVTAKGYNDYQDLLKTGKYKQKTVKPGEKLPIPGADITVVTSNGDAIDKPLPGAGARNPMCSKPDAMPADIDLNKDIENARSVGFMMTFGKIHILDLGDLTWEKERPLMCPTNKLGHVNLWIVSNHGQEPSDSPILVDGITPQVAILNNGERKGAAVRVLDLIRNAPGKPDLWQLHTAMLGGELNTDPTRIANLLSPEGEAAAKAAAAAPPPEPGAPRTQGGQRRPNNAPDDAGYMITVEAQPNGSFTVTNERTTESHTYIAH